MGKEGFPTRFGNWSAQGPLPEVGGKGKRTEVGWDALFCPDEQLLLGCGEHVGASTVAVPSGGQKCF